MRLSATSAVTEIAWASPAAVPAAVTPTGRREQVAAGEQRQEDEQREQRPARAEHPATLRRDAAAVSRAEDGTNPASCAHAGA